MSVNKIIFNRLSYFPADGSGDYYGVPKYVCIPAGTKIVALCDMNDGSLRELFCQAKKDLIGKVVAFSTDGTNYAELDSNSSYNVGDFYDKHKSKYVVYLKTMPKLEDIQSIDQSYPQSKVGQVLKKIVVSVTECREISGGGKVPL